MKYKDGGSTLDEFKKWESDRESDREGLKLNLQLFASKKNDKQEILDKIEAGTMNQEKFDLLKRTFDSSFEKGVRTPIETITNNKDRFYHIVNGHEADMFSEEAIVSIIQTLVYPKAIYKTKDFLGREANSYVGKINGSTLLVITRNDIITAYMPSENYFRKNILQRGEKIYGTNNEID